MRLRMIGPGDAGATSMPRDDFTKVTIELLAKRVGYVCSNPGCQTPTTGPHSDDEKAVSVGVAAHIAAASAGGPRYDASQTPTERKASSNGIWLCQTCARLIDVDTARYTRDVLLGWKDAAEASALAKLESPVASRGSAIEPTNLESPPGDFPQRLSEFTVVFLGAGFSRCATVGRAPLMSDFFRGLDNEKYWMLDAFLRKTFSSLEAANIEEALAHLDQMQDSPIHDEFHDAVRSHDPAIRKELGRYCIDRLGDFSWKPDNWILSNLASVGPTTTVITTNYDNIAERILSGRPGLRHFHAKTNCPHCKMRKLLADAETVALDELTGWQGAILKLHGSVAWKICRNDDCPAKNKLIADRHCRPLDDFICASCDAECEPGIVLPQMKKSYSEFPQLPFIWEAARLALETAESIAIIGFSLPPSDSAVWQLLRRSFMSTKNLKHIGIFDIEPNTVATRLTNLLDSPDDYDWPMRAALYEIPKDCSYPSWLVAEKTE